MKKLFFSLLIAVFALPGLTFAQDKKTVWPELKSFHEVMAATFHPAEEGNLAPLKQKARELFKAAEQWQESAIPEGFKPEETLANLKQLTIKCSAVKKAVEAKMSDADLTKLIGEAHDVFHKIVRECRKEAE